MRTKTHQKIISIDQIQGLLVQYGLLGPNAVLTGFRRDCYCEDRNCNCPPDAMIFHYSIVEPNYCLTCGANGDQPCQTKTKQKTMWHKSRKYLVGPK